MDAQDPAPADRSAANRSGSEPSFSVSSPSLPSQTVRSEASHKTVEAAPMSSAAIVQELGHGLDRIQQHGSHRVDLRLSLEGGGEVSIALQMRDGAVHASFQTASPELREALQQGWAQMANRENQAIPLADPVFKGPSTTPNNAGQQQDPRERREGPPAEQRPAPPVFPATSHPIHRAVQPPAPARSTSSGLNAWA
jgi:flagellar hook-length control protein FliK